MSLVINIFQGTGKYSKRQLYCPVKDAILPLSPSRKFNFLCETSRQQQATG